MYEHLGFPPHPVSLPDFAIKENRNRSREISGGETEVSLYEV